MAYIRNNNNGVITYDVGALMRMEKAMSRLAQRIKILEEKLESQIPDLEEGPTFLEEKTQEPENSIYKQLLSNTPVGMYMPKINY